MKNQQPGFLKLIIFIVILVVILSVLGVNLRGVVESPMVQENFRYVWNYVLIVYHYIADLWQTYIWPNLVTFWNWFKTNNHVPTINPIPPFQA